LNAMKTPRKVSLLFCLLMDALGYATYTIPILGEFADIVWAPVSAFIFYRTFGSWKGSMFNFLEEVLPGFDFIPSFTLMWLWRLGKSGKSVVPEVRKRYSNAG
jgi:hypothetical protein